MDPFDPEYMVYTTQSGLDLLRVSRRHCPRETCHRPGCGRHRDEGRPRRRGRRPAAPRPAGPPAASAAPTPWSTPSSTSPPTCATTASQRSANPPRRPASPSPASSTRRDGVAVYAANLGWRDVPLRALLAERLGGVPSPSATTCAPAASPRAGSARAGAPTASCSWRWAPASPARSASTAGSRRARTASPARSATSSYAPAGPRAVRAARLPGAVRLGGRRRRGMGGGRRRPGGGRRGLREGRGGRRPAAPSAVWQRRRRRARRRPGHRPHPAGPAHARSSAAGSPRPGKPCSHRCGPPSGAGHLPETARDRPRGPGRQRRMPGRGPARLGSPQLDRPWR